MICQHVDSHQNPPSKNALAIALEQKERISQNEHDGCLEIINGLIDVPEDYDWLVLETEKFCQRQALNNAISEAVEIQDNFERPPEDRDDRIPEIGALPEILQDALTVCFDSSVGHDYFSDYEERFRSFRERTNKVKFDIDILNKITKGGAERKTLNIIMAGVNVGKSLGLCHLAAGYLTQGYNVLYISMEMAEEVCAKRIDANLIDVDLDDFDTLTYSYYKEKIQKYADSKSVGRLMIKQFPTGGANVNHFNALMDELKMKKEFIPDIVICDYLGIMSSSRMKGYSENSYHLVKSIAEELRGFAIRHNVVVWSAAQTGRQAWGSSDVGMEDVAESAGLPATADFMLAVIETEELVALEQQLFKQIKSRYGNKSINAKFTLGVIKGKQRWYELDATDAGPKPVEQTSRDMQAEAVHNAHTPRGKMDAFAAATDDIQF